MTKLKPCPLCGGDVDFYDSANGLCGTGLFVITCMACELRTDEGYVLKEYKPAKEDSKTYAKKLIIQRWNRRTK